MPARAHVRVDFYARAPAGSGQDEDRTDTMNLTHRLSLRLDLDRQPQDCVFSLSQTLPPPDVRGPLLAWH
ncbi:hypothetical protein GALMADRAFT_917157 [Galerina marginata CBS 339.88]|uniref:Uncharacterized protein n=1 Tax=Galerina marginata (strain CBS 339.88) TaxID=685588 RepID=A0A067SFD1_GALM3|nr:hypothetical protein GALMADRAFT_917157 [Galerina marginata CBS 339.88]